MNEFEPDEVDVVIIGTGLTGATYARIIADSCPHATLLLIEAGPQLSSPAGMHVRNILDAQQQELAFLRAQGPDQTIHPSSPIYSPRSSTLQNNGILERPGLFLLDSQPVDRSFSMPSAAMTSCVGGMGVLWRGSCPKPNGSEVTTLIPQREFDLLIQRAYSLLGIELSRLSDNSITRAICNSLAKSSGAGYSPPFEPRPLPLAVSTNSSQRYWTGTEVILGGIARGLAANASILSRRLCRSLLVEQGRVVGVELEALDSGATSICLAQFVVVAADPFRTPQLLYASGIRPSTLGYYLNEHIQVTASITLSWELQNEIHQTLRADTPSTGGCWLPFAEERWPYHGQVLYEINPVVLGGLDMGLKTIGVSLYGRKDICSYGRLSFSDTEKDFYGMPKLSIDYRLSEKDAQTAETMQAVIPRFAHKLGEIQHVNLLPPGASLHYLGTTRMAAQSDMGVCDSFGRVYGVQNLYIGGAGLIETATACNPALTCIALAIRGAERIVCSLATSSP